MALTKIGSIGINTGIAFAGVTTIATLNASDNVLSVGGTVNFNGDVSIGGTLTYEDVTNIDSVGLITARDGIVVGSGITLSVDGDGFFTGVVTATTFSGTFSGDGTSLTGVASTDNIRTNTNATFLQNINVSGTVTATSYAGDGSALTGLQAGKFLTDGVGITTNTPVGIETTSLARKDLIGPAGNTSTGAGSSFHGAYIGDGFLSFNTDFSNPTGYYISTFTNSLVAGPMSLGSTMTIDGTFTIV